MTEQERLAAVGSIAEKARAELMRVFEMSDEERAKLSPAACRTLHASLRQLGSTVGILERECVRAYYKERRENGET